MARKHSKGGWRDDEDEAAVRAMKAALAHDADIRAFADKVLGIVGAAKAAAGGQ